MTTPKRGDGLVDGPGSASGGTTGRRTFLKSSAAALASAGLVGCGPRGETGSTPEAARTTLAPRILRAVGDVVLPGEIGPEGREGAVTAFEGWLTAYEPVAELNHGYGTSEIRYAPPDPAPGWNAQLEALDLEARRRFDSAFAELAPADRRALLRRHLTDTDRGLSDPLRARHVAVALMAHWFGSTEAVDRCYGARIGRSTCRGLEGVSAEPTPLEADR